MALNRSRLVALVVLVVVVLAGGCSGTLPGTGGEAATPAPDEAPAATPTATTTPTATPTPTPTATPTPEPTPVPDHRDYERFGRLVADEVNTYVEGEYAAGSGDLERGVVAVAIRKPDEWTVQNAEMEVAREIARFAGHATRQTADKATEDGAFVRPDEYRVTVVDEDGTNLSRVTIDPDIADKYVFAEVDVETYAEHIANSRTVLTSDGSVTISEGDSEVALLGAEYRPIVYFHATRAENHGSRSPEERDNVEFDRVEILASEKTIYYETVHEEGQNIPAQSGQVQRTYLWTIKQVWKGTPRVNRLPETVKYYQDTSQVSYADPHFLITIKTRWALDYFELSQWVMPGDKTMTAQELDAYYNKITDAQQSSEDGFDYLNETSEASRYVPTYPD